MPSTDVIFPCAPVQPYWSDSVKQRFGVPDCGPFVAKPQINVADIPFHPNRSIFEARRTTRETSGNLVKSVPFGWPTRLQGPLVWSDGGAKDETSFIYHLNNEDRKEIRTALASVIETGLSLDKINKTNFQVPNLRQRLEQARQQLYEGIGISVIRGLDIDNYSPQECLMIFLGLSSYIAPERGAQDQLGNLLGHLIDYGRDDSDRELPMHTDITADIVATCTLVSSLWGGDAIVASSWDVYNELARTRPDLIHVLAQTDWPFDTYGRDPPYYNRSILFYHNEKVMINFSRRVLTGHPFSGRTEGIPGLNEAQAEALDAVHFLARKHQIRFATEKGDFRFINNFAVLHGREAYGDHDTNWDVNVEEPKSQRHLLRLWLHNTDMAWQLPPTLKLVWARTFDKTRRRTWQAVERLPGSLTLPGSPGPTPPDPISPGPSKPRPYPCD